MEVENGSLSSFASRGLSTSTLVSRSVVNRLHCRFLMPHATIDGSERLESSICLCSFQFLVLWTLWCIDVRPSWIRSPEDGRLTNKSNQCGNCCLAQQGHLENTICHNTTTYGQHLSSVPSAFKDSKTHWGWNIRCNYFYIYSPTYLQ